MNAASPQPTYTSNQKIQEEVWKGFLPIQLSLHPSSLSSPSMPPSLFKLVPRHSFLHIALKDEIQRLYAYAPSRIMMGSFSNDRGQEFKSVTEPMDDILPNEDEETTRSTSTQHNPDDVEKDEKEIPKDTHSSTLEIDSDSHLHRATEEVVPTESIVSSPAANTETFHASNGLIEIIDTNMNPSSTSSLQQQQVGRAAAAAAGGGVIPHCWFIDQETNIPLRWHVFIGILYDRIICHHHHHHKSYSFQEVLPWKVQVSFTSYPTDILIPLPIEDESSSSNHRTTTIPSNDGTTKTACVITKAIQQIFTNSFKQALYLQYNTNRIALNSMTKQMHQQVWSSILRNKYELYRQIQEQVMNTSMSMSSRTTGTTFTTDINTSCMRIPVGLWMDHQPLKVRPCFPWLLDETVSSSTVTTTTTTTTTCFQGDGIQHETSIVDNKQRTFMTLGQYLYSNLPIQYFQLLHPKHMVDNDSKYNPTCTIIQDKNHIWIPLFTWMIQGIQQISFHLPMIELWKIMCHPDHFLYIIISKS